MSICDLHFDPPNIPSPTMGGKKSWDVLWRCSGYTLQQNRFTSHCRILNKNNIRVAWGEEGPMRAKFRKITKSPTSNHAQYGDVIGVHRLGALYDHYGVYKNDSCVYEYAAEHGDFGNPSIHQTTLAKFIGDSGNYYVLTFPEKHDAPGKVAMPVAYALGGATDSPITLDWWKDLPNTIKDIFSSETYHLYSPLETIQRAEQRLGETDYNLAINNCEHFAIWCKTGISESHQVAGLLRAIVALISRIPF